MAILVVSRQRNQVEGLGEIGARSDGAALLGLQLGHMLAELGVHHGDLSVLHNEALDALHGLLGVVRHLDGGSRLLAMIVDLPVQRNLQTDLAIREGESLADQRAGQTLATIEGSVLQLLDHQTDHAPLVLAIVLGVAHKCPDGVLDAQGLAIVVALLLQSNGAGRIGREVEGERMGVAAQFADQLLLHRCHLHVGIGHGHNLLPAQDKLLGELHSHDLVLLATIAIGGGQLAKDFPVL